MNNIKLRIAFWVKDKWSSCDESLVDIARFPNLIKVPLRVKSVRTVKSWKYPPFGSMKFNVDGFSRDKLGLTGIDGVLKDNTIAVIIVFSKAIEVVDSNVAKLLVVREAM